MRAVIQRVLSAHVEVDGQRVADTGKGLLVLFGINVKDTKEDAEYIVKKVLNLRLWPDDTDRAWRRSVCELGGDVLCVSQFTLYAATHKGRKPDFHAAMGGERAEETYNGIVDLVRSGLTGGGHVGDGRFGAFMHVGLVNDGPVTIIIDSQERKREVELRRLRAQVEELQAAAAKDDAA